MNILVCIKQVPDMEAKFTIDADGVWFNRTDLAWRMNEYDEYAVEQAVRQKEQDGGDLTVLCIGADQVKETMKKALAMGCDRGVHVVDDRSYLKDPYEIASIIAEFAKDKGFDLIFTGMQSQDRGSGQVGVMLAEMLGMTSITTIVGFSCEDGRVKARRELEGGIKAVVQAALPVLLTCQLGLNTPRYPTLPNIMKAKKKELLTIPVADLHRVSSLQKTLRIALPEKRCGGVYLEGEPAAIAERLIAILKEKTSVLA